jgi:hypothetical protein
MVKLPSDVKEVMLKQKLLPIATANSKGVPNVVFVGMWKLLDDENLMIVDNFLNKTRKNLEENPRIAIVAYDGETRKSYQIKGSITIETEGSHYDDATQMAASKKLPGKAAVIVHVEEIYNAAYGPNAGMQIA